MTQKSLLSRALVVGSGAVISSLASYLMLAVASRKLDVDSYALFASFWGGFFLLASLIGALDLEASRQAAINNHKKVERSLILVAAVCAVVFSSIWIGLSWLTISQDRKVVLTGLGGIWLVTFLGLIRGSVIGFGRVRTYRNLIAGEGVLRLILIAAIGILATYSTTSFVLATISGFLVWIPLSKMILKPVKNIPFRITLKNVQHLIWANLGTAILIAGLPWLIAMNSHLSANDVGALTNSAMLARLPIIAFSMVQALLIPYFTQNSLHLKSWPKVATLALGAVALTEIATILIGPYAFSIIFGTLYSASGFQLAILILSSWALVAHMILVSRLISSSRHLYAAQSWLAGSIVGLVGIPMIATTTTDICILILTASVICLAVSFVRVKQITRSSVAP